MSEPPMPPEPPGQPLPHSEGPPSSEEPWPHLPQEPWPQYQQRDPVPGQQPSKKPKRFGWSTMIITAVVALGLGGIIGASGYGIATTAEPNANLTATETATETIMEEGTYEIGVDAKSGRYKTRVPEDSPGCYWERTTDDSGDYDSIIANADLNPGALASVTLKSGDFFSSDSCGTWTRV